MSSAWNISSYNALYSSKIFSKFTSRKCCNSGPPSSAKTHFCVPPTTRGGSSSSQAGGQPSPDLLSMPILLFHSLCWQSKEGFSGSRCWGRVWGIKSCEGKWMGEGSLGRWNELNCRPDSLRKQMGSSGLSLSIRGSHVLPEWPGLHSPTLLSLRQAISDTVWPQLCQLSTAEADPEGLKAGGCVLTAFLHRGSKSCLAGDMHITLSRSPKQKCTAKVIIDGGMFKSIRVRWGQETEGSPSQLVYSLGF